MKKITLLLLLSFSFSFGQVLTQDFEGGLTLPAGWTNNDIQGGGEVWTFATGGEAVGYTPPNTLYYSTGLLVGNYALFDSDGYGGAGPAENAALESPAFDCSSLTLIELSFNHYFTAGYGGIGYVEVYNGSSWIQVASYTGASQTNSSFGLVTLDVTTQLTGVTNARVRFRWTGDYAWGWAFDNVVVQEGPSCLVPTTFTAGTVTTTSFEVNWVDTNTGTPTWEIEWGAEGFTQGAGTPVTGLTATTYNFTPLTADTTYDFYIRTNCGGAEGDSDWVGPISFTTLYDCSTLGIPYSQDFDNANLYDSCYTTEDVDADGISWISQQDLDLDGDTVPETFATNGNSSVAKNDWLFSPALSLTGGVSYDVTTVFNTFSGNGNFEAFILSTPNSSATPVASLFSQTNIVPMGTFAELETMAYQQVNTFTPATSGDYYIAHHSFGAASSGFILLFNSSINTSLGVDDFDTNTFTHFYNKDVDVLTLNSTSLAFDNISIFNVLGQEVINRNLSQMSETIDMSSLKDGVYLAKVTIEGQSQTIKLLKH
ncbi:MAG: T9SS type A sorting domain-containing protein [Gelidibacter sp.]|nr:T9SS type A sorting domain-containing protein [Gelidibacter sp.]